MSISKFLTGRGRAENAIYIVIAEEGSKVAEKEKLNEARQRMMTAAMDKINRMPEAVRKERIEKIQKDNNSTRRALMLLEDKRSEESTQVFSPLNVL